MLMCAGRRIEGFTYGGTVSTVPAHFIGPGGHTSPVLRHIGNMPVAALSTNLRAKVPNNPPSN